MKKIIALLLLLACFQVSAQNLYPVAQEQFGKSRIQMRRLDWRTINSNNFEFNYYRGGQELTLKAAEIAEGEYRRITEILGYTPFTTMKIFLYNSSKALEQSNIGHTSPVEYDGGILNLSRSRIEIAYTGNDSLFKKELIHQISGLFVYDMLFGGSLKEVLQSSLLLSVPEWYMSGMSAYIAQEGFRAEDLEDLRAAIVRNESKKLSNITGDDAEIIGQSVWNYIAVRYGQDNISNILNLTRIIRAEQSSITSTLGISFVRFVNDWKAFYISGNPVNQSEIQGAGAINNNAVSINIGSNETSKLTDLIEGEVDTEYYEFDEVNVIKANELERQIEPENSSTFNRSRLRRGLEEFKVSAPRSYTNLLLAQDLKVDIYNDPLRRLGLNGSMMINDILENHVLKFELFITPSLKSHDINVSYTNYEKRIDWGVTFERRSVHLEQIHDKQFYLFRPLKILLPDVSLNRRIFLNKISANISYPFSNNLKMNFNPGVFVNKDIDYQNLGKDILGGTYTSLATELVFDNTKKSSERIFLNGTRAKIAYQKNLNFSGSEQNFNRLNIDARHYQRLASGLQFAARFNYGNSKGQNPKYTFLGGMENTMNRDVHPALGQVSGNPGDLRDIVFYNYAGNLRGFDFAKLYGTSHLLVNLELRLSLAGYLPKNTVTSSFIRNLQLVTFSDIGTAWNGNKGPWSRQNSLNTQIVGGANTPNSNNPFYAVVTNFKNPFIIGYGAGIRTTILGFFIKADYGFGLENKEIGKGKFYLSLGQDF